MFNDEDELPQHTRCETCAANLPCPGYVVEAKSPMSGIRCCSECLADWQEAAEHEAAEKRGDAVKAMAEGETRATGPSHADIALASARSGHDVKNCRLGGCGACEAAMDALDDGRFDEETETRRIPLETMAALVFPRPAPKRVRLPSRLIFVVAFSAMVYGCATGRPVAVDAPETVGKLAAGPSIWHAPTHPTTDFGHAEIVSTDEEAPTTVAADGGGDAEAPAPVEKAAHGF